MAQNRVFDTSAVVAFLRDEPGAQRVEEIITESRRENASLLITTVNLGEVWYAMARYRGDADVAILHIMKLGILPVDLTWDIAREAASLRLKTKMSYADCCAAACSKMLKLPLVTSDYDFKVFEREVKIQWLKRR
jgi:predicted nucleic acid-binding protein